MEKLITGLFAQTLEANRARFNARFAEARRFKPNLNAEALAEHLRSVVAPIVEAVARQNPAAATETVETLYDLSLDLIGQELLGPASRYPAINEGWKTVLPSLPQHLASAPRAVISAITNALYNFSLEPSARPGEWMKLMLELAPLCPDVDTLLKAGQVAAWRSGLAHYRQGALEICRTLDEKIARAVLGISPINTLPITTILEHLQTNPWLNPNGITQLSITNNRLQIVAHLGAFRGFGGLFVSPPLVFSSGEHFIVTDGDGSWLLTADCFGATWHRTEAQPVDLQTSASFSLNRAGQVSVDGKPIGNFPELANAQSTAANKTTLAVTTPLSHSVYLVALAE
ncbi:MAG: hypothetical protein HYZ49_14630 [Chloroflexi bacterium]|nr:hypothetical protein [Chloroflexota bacterium]